MSHNPYLLEGQQPTLRTSVFVFMDILGYSDLMTKVSKNGESEEELRRLHEALSESRRELEENHLTPTLKEMYKKDSFVVKAFTDNIVIGWPVHDDAEMEFGSAFHRLGMFQLKMALRGYFVRGAIAVGGAYIDEIAVFGEALAEAYIGESKQARDPRIILTKSAVNAAKQHLDYYFPPSDAPHVRDILKDSDGQWFLNYLDTIMIAVNERGPFYEELLQHKRTVERKLKEHASNPPIWAKYAWVANYHNYFCELHDSYFSEEHRIDVSLYTATPSLITD